MEQLSPQQLAGRTLRRLIQKYYATQQEFAEDYGMELRNVSRYINNGINKLDTIQELAQFFKVSYLSFFTDEQDS